MSKKNPFCLLTKTHFGAKILKQYTNYDLVFTLFRHCWYYYQLWCFKVRQKNKFFASKDEIYNKYKLQSSEIVPCKNWKKV